MCAVALLAVDVARGGGRLSFLAWNLLLAWAPFPFAMGAWRLAASGRRTLAGIGLVGWLLFLPNAPYIVTDALHLQSPNATRADVVLVAAFAACGLGAGLLSIRVAHETLRLLVGRRVRWALLATVAGLTAFGVYLGRFVRFNSWDAVFRPSEVARTTVELLAPPYYSRLAVAGVTVAAALFAAAYLATYMALPRLAALPSRVARSRRRS